MPYAPRTHRQTLKELGFASPKRQHSTQRGYGRRWRKVRLIQLRREPLCRRCGELATEVDHIVPIAKGGAMSDLANLQALCKRCHSRKTVAQDGGFGRCKATH